MEQKVESDRSGDAGGSGRSALRGIAVPGDVAAGVGSQVADLGSGGGFPGFPLAVLRPDVEVTLVESDQRKAAFLREVSDFAGNIRVRCIRAESLEGTFDAVVGRAIRPADILATARRIAGGFGILLSRSDAEVLAGSVNSQVWPLPWAPSSAALVGLVPREQSKSANLGLFHVKRRLSDGVIA